MSSRMNWERAAQQDKVRARPEPVDTYWLTIFRNGVRCSECGNHGAALAGVEVAGYRHHDQHVLCEACMERYGIAAKPSKRYLAFKSAGQNQTGRSKRWRRRRG